MEEPVVGRRCKRLCGSGGRDWALHLDGCHRIATGNNVDFRHCAVFHTTFHRSYFIVTGRKRRYSKIARRIRRDNFTKISVVTANDNLSS